MKRSHARACWFFTKSPSKSVRRVYFWTTLDVASVQPACSRLVVVAGRLLPTSMQPPRVVAVSDAATPPFVSDHVPPPTGGYCATAVLSVFCLHNAWTCWVFLNFTNISPAAALLGVTDAQISSITAAGWCGTLAAIPVVTLARASWHRPLLLLAGLANSIAPVVRYLAASRQLFPVVVATNFINGAVFGVFSAWPPMFAVMQWPAERHTVVTALGALSNYVGGALAAPAMPLIANTVDDLLYTFKVQAIIACPMALILFVWLRFLPPFRSTTAAGATLSTQLRRSCCEPRAAALIFTLGLAVGLSLLLQGAVQEMLSGVGFTDVEAGNANCVYQSASAVVGVVLGSQLTSTTALVPTLHFLNGLSAASYLALSAVSAILLKRGRDDFSAAPALMLASMTMLGSSLMGMLPVLLQFAISQVNALENVMSGSIYMVAMVAAATLTTPVALLNGGMDFVLVGVLLTAELIGYLVVMVVIRPACRGSTGAARSYRRFL